MNTLQVRPLLVMLFSFLLLGCEESLPIPEQEVAGSIFRSELIYEYSPTETSQILGNIGLPETQAIHSSIRAIKIIYYSPGLDGELQKLSGALIFPVDALTHPMLSIQHGTVTRPTEVASVNPMNSSAGIAAILTATQGYIALVPDYSGYGVSTMLHPYLHAESLANSVIDMIRASRTYCTEQNIILDERLFLTGYSEGGYASLATQKLIESEYSDEFVLTAVAPMAGPYDLYATAHTVLEGGSYQWPAYIGFMFVAYNELYGFNNLDEVFVSPFDEQVKEMYDGVYSFFEINNQLPTDIEDFIRSDFRDSFLAGNEQSYSDAFRENSLLDWSPTTPIRLFHGLLDHTVPYIIAEAALDSLRAHGAEEVNLVGIPDANHESAGMPAIYSMLDWFSTFDRGSELYNNFIQ